MKKFLLGTVGLVALGMAAPALAADMHTPVKAHRCLTSPRSMTGRASISAPTAAGARATAVWISLMRAGVDFVSGCGSRSGGLFGGQLGYRWQASQWVFGLEAQGDWADLSNQRISIFNNVLYPHQDRWHRPFHRPDRLRLERLAVLLQGRRGGDRQPL